MRPRRISTAFGVLAVSAALSACDGSSGTATRKPTPPQKRTTQPQPTPTPRGTGTGAAVSASNALALELLDRIGNPDANVVLSPYSIQAALAMAYAGAAGTTGSQLGHVLGGSSAPVLAASNAALASRLAGGIPGTGKDAAQLNLANSLWVQSGFALQPAFTQTLVSEFDSAAQALDFNGRPEAARSVINRWVASRTAGRITNLMPAGSISSQTKLVLADALYLKARWATPFDPQATEPGTFMTATGSKVTTKFMGLPATELRYAGTPAATVLELPYRGSTLSMLVVMPAAGTLPALQPHLSAAGLARLERSLQTRRIRLQMPRFHLNTHADLVQTLSALGMPIAFSDSADFSGITAQVPLKIAAVEHGADLMVDEQGTVATAATGISIRPTAAAPLPATNVMLNRPFLLFLRDQRTGAILFAGRLDDPTAR